MTTYKDKKLEELSNAFGWEGQFGKNSGAEKAVRDFISNALDEQMNMVMECVDTSDGIQNPAHLVNKLIEKGLIK